MKKVTLAEVRQLALAAKNDLWAEARSYGRDVKLYLHWSAGHYGQFFEDYHFNIDADAGVYVSTDDLSEVKSHTWRRNSGSIGLSMACCAFANTNNLGSEPPTSAQVDALAQVVATLAYSLDLTIDKDRVMTHAEAADLDDYGPATTCERWDLWFLPGIQKGKGGDVVREQAKFYVDYWKREGFPW